ncbi:MAG: hypothetical protein EOO16_26160, partial [Chitinophagaceae bacterium]
MPKASVLFLRDHGSRLTAHASRLTPHALGHPSFDRILTGASAHFLTFARNPPQTAYMNFNLSQIPERINKPRTSGLTMVMD